MLSRAEAQAFYDRFGARQDRQAFYEDRALAELLEHGAFETARSVFELGCGTGRFAEILLSGPLPADAVYVGVELSSTMVDLARRRLAPFAERATVRPTQGDLPLSAEEGSCDRFVSTFVFDLLPVAEIGRLLTEAHRLLSSRGRLCAAGLGEGSGVASRWVASLWSRVASRRPGLVGGCRPLSLLPLLRAEQWRILHHATVTAWALPMEVLVAERHDLETPPVP